MTLLEDDNMTLMDLGIEDNDQILIEGENSVATGWSFN